MTVPLGRSELRITIGAILPVSVCVVTGETGALLCAVLALAVHEAAHAIAAKNLGIPVARVTVYPFGAVMHLGDTTSGRRAEGIVAAAGPLASLTFAALLRLTETILPAGDWIGRLTGANLAIAIGNLLPAFPLDGGRIFRALLQGAVRERTARAILLTFTVLTALGMTGCGVYLAMYGIAAWTLFLIPPFLVVSAVAEWRMPDAGIVSRVMERRAALRGGAAQKAQTVVLSEQATVGTAIASLSGSRFTILRVMRGSGFTEIEEGAVLDAAAKFGMQIPLKTVILRLTDGK